MNRSAMNALAITAVALTALAAAAVVWGDRRWVSATQMLVARVEGGRTSPQPRRVDWRELNGLPAPVQRYFRAVLKDDAPIVAAASIAHTGTFNASETGERWSAFTSTQRVVSRNIGFVWDARVAMLPGLGVRVHDAYVAGEGQLHASLLGLFTVADQRDTPDMAQGELMRFVAEAAWYPTALLPSQGVRWQAVNDNAAKATLTDGTTTVTLRFRFNPEGLIHTVRADARARTVNGEVHYAPWEGRFWNVAERGGMRIPLDGEVSWLLPEGPRPYWRGHLESVAYEFAAP